MSRQDYLLSTHTASVKSCIPLGLPIVAQIILYMTQYEFGTRDKTRTRRAGQALSRKRTNVQQKLNAYQVQLEIFLSDCRCREAHQPKWA